MGVLETRNLDFDHVLLLSCNEGNMPRGVNDTSFIPYAIRKAYGLTTVDHKVAIYQHYFHRLLQRATDVTIVYNNATSDGQTGEMSRFMLQLMIERPAINFKTLKAGQKSLLHTPHPVSKTPHIMQLLGQRFSRERGGISPTAICNYLRCQLRFFYRYVCELQEPDGNDDEIIDNRIFGNIFHQASQTLYERFGRQRVTASMLDDLLKSAVEIEQAVDNAIKSEVFNITDPLRPMPSLDGLQLINREVIIKYVRQLLEVDRRLTPFTILGLELPVYTDISYSVPADNICPSVLLSENSYSVTMSKNSPSVTMSKLRIGGMIDRLDSVTDPETGEERIRVVDYKTGSRRQKSFADVEAIFDPANIRDHSDYYLQTFLYSYIVRHDPRLNPQGLKVSPSLLFIQHAGSDDYDPTLKLDKAPVVDIADVSPQYMQQLTDKISDIFNQDLALSPTNDPDRCRTCPYASLCGR